MNSDSQKDTVSYLKSVLHKQFMPSHLQALSTVRRKASSYWNKFTNKHWQHVPKSVLCHSCRRISGLPNQTRLYAQQSWPIQNQFSADHSHQSGWSLGDSKARQFSDKSLLKYKYKTWRLYWPVKYNQLSFLSIIYKRILTTNKTDHEK